MSAVDVGQDAGPARRGVKTWLFVGATGLGQVIEPQPPATTEPSMPVPEAVPVALEPEPARTPPGAPLAKLEESLSRAQARWRQELRSLTEEMRDALDGIEKAIAALNLRVDAASRPADPFPDLEKVRDRIGAIEVRLGRLDQRSRVNQRLLRGEAGARRRGKALPFTAESIDWWGDAPSVVVRAGGTTRFLTPGDTVVGWQLVEVDRSARHARFTRDSEQAIVEVQP